MKAQSRLGSLAEAAQNILIGFAIQTAATYFIGPIFHMRPGVGDVVGFGLVMTVISIARTYGIRRWNELRRGKNTPPDFVHIAEELAAERNRQIGGEGYSTAHDDEHTGGELARAAGAYAWVAGIGPIRRRELNEMDRGDGRRLLALWPWSFSVFKPTHPRRDLIKAGALIIAEIGRIDRANALKQRSGSAQNARRA